MSDLIYLFLFSVIILAVLFSWIKSERIINPVSVFVIWWGGFIYLSTFKIAGMRLPSESTYNLLITSVALFSIGAITFIKTRTKLNSESKTNESNIFIMPNKMRTFFWAQIVITVILLFFLTKSVALLATMNPGVYRNLLYSEHSIFGGFKAFITYFIEPSLYISALVSICGVFLYKFPKRFVVLAVFNLGLFSGVTIGRAPIFILIICIFIIITFSVSENIIRLKVKYLLVTLIPIAFIIWISLLRRKNYGMDAFLILRNYFIWYLTGPFTALELFLDNFHLNYDYDYSYIRGLFAGIEDILRPLTIKLFPGYTPINDDFHTITKVYRSLGGIATGHNSHYTMLYSFMRDAGIYGVIVFSYILGAVNALFYNNFRNKTNITNFSLMVIMLYLSLMGITRWELRYTWSWLTIIGIILIGNKFILSKPKRSV